LTAALSGQAFAAAPEEPVKAVMDLATALWSDDPKADGQDYFDKTRLNTLYSKAFVDIYHQAAKFPIYDDSDGPFGYDVITNGQDGCPLKDVVIAPGATANDLTDVKVTFKLWTCIDDGSVDKNSVSEVHFDVVTEDGKPVIADIHRKGDDGKLDSLVKEMQDIVKSGQDAGPEAPPADDNAKAPAADAKPTIILSQPE
jgi:hypothetical protein